MLKRLFFATGLAILASVPAHAAVVTGAGPRVGFSVSPDQLVLGGHLEIGDVAPSLTFSPNLELGLGSDLTTVGINFDLHYHFNVQNTDWRPYVGGGIGINFTEVDRRAPIEDVSNTGVGGNLVAGAGVPTRSGNRFFGEIRFGLGSELAQLKLIAGWNFKM